MPARHGRAHGQVYTLSPPPGAPLGRERDIRLFFVFVIVPKFDLCAMFSVITTGQYAPNWRVSSTQLIRNTPVLRIKLLRPPQYARFEVTFQ